MSRHFEQGGEHAWYQVEQMGGCAVVHAGGEIDASTIHEFDGAEHEAEGLSPRVVIDLAQVTFVDSSGLGALIVARKTAREHGGSIALVAPPPMVRRLLGSTQLQDAFAIYDSVAEAINAPTQR